MWIAEDIEGKGHGGDVDGGNMESRGQRGPRGHRGPRTVEQDRLRGQAPIRLPLLLRGWHTTDGAPQSKGASLNK